MGRVKSGARRGRVIGRRPLSPGVTELRIQVAGPPLAYRAGQHVVLTLSEAPGVAHHYSIAAPQSGKEPRVLELAIGNASGADVLAGAPVGAELGVEGPLDGFGFRAAPGAILVGAGTGVVPLRALVRAALADGAAPRLALLAGSRTRADILWREELDALAREHPHFLYEPVLSQPDGSWTGRTGYVQDHLGEVVRRLPVAIEAYVCGSPPMVESCRAALFALGIPAERIQSEAYA